MTNELYHDVIEIRHIPDGELMCMISRPYFNRHDLNKIIGQITKFSENFSIISYQNKVKNMIKTAEELHSKVSGVQN